MEGMARAANRQFDLCVTTAYHAVAFYGAAVKDRLEPLSAYLSSGSKRGAEEDERLANAQLIAGFHSLKARGIPIDISRVN
jgi:hypothetical protein